MRHCIPLKRWAFTLLAILSSQLLLAQEPIWSDEFDGSTIDKSIWTYKTGGDGNGNGELQYYTAAAENAYVENGSLVIEARREEYEGKQFTSARLRTLGRFAYKFGTLEARIKLPDVADGLWPAFWMMGNNFGQVGWPKCGEIDILEVGYKAALDSGTANSSVSAAAHWWQESGDWSDWLQADYSKSTTIDGTFYDDYHLFKLEWTPTAIVVSVDDRPYFTMDITDPNLSEFVDNPAFIILNLAVGGFNFVDITDPNQITATFPAKMYVDYVRLYENEHTEIFLAEEQAHRDNFGIFTETTAVDGSLNFGDPSTNLYIWNNMEAVTTSPAEGGSALAYTVAPGDWWGMGVSSADQNMKNYANGFLNFQCKTTASTTFTVSIASTAADGSGVKLAAGGEEYGLVRDGEWHSVAIPLNKFSNVDFYTVKQLFAVSGDDPGSEIEIAFDDIYWSESVPLPTPEFGNFGVYTETPANKNAGEFGFGVNGDLFIWENTLTLSDTEPAEGNTALSFTSNGLGWYGFGLTARTAHNLSAFDNEEGAFHFSLKTAATADFRIGMKSGSVDGIGQKWIWFRNGQDPYGFVRDGQWHEVTIPIADIASEVDLTNVAQLFQMLGTGEISDIAIDNIYFSGGQAAQDPGTDGPSVNRAPKAVLKASITGGSAPLDVDFDATASTDPNGDALTYDWNFGDGATATGATAQHTFTADGTYTVTLTVADSALSSKATQLVIVNDQYGLTKSKKRGVGYGSHSEADMAALSAGTTWWYNWFHQPDAQVASVYQNYGMEFVPMAWNGGFNEQAMRNYLSAHPEVKYVLGWNEPNFLEQANMTPSEAAAEWPRLEAIADEFGLKIVSPAMNFCGNCVTENGTTYTDPVEYFDDFFAACTDCRVDAIAIHAYMGTVGALEWYVGLFEKYGKPIWLTEFANWENDPTLEDQKHFLVQAVDYLENEPSVERYAWFTGRHNGPPYIGLLEQQSGVLSELGQIYVNMPVHDPAIYHEVPGVVEAEHYTSMQGVRPELTEDAGGFLHLSEISAGDWMQYQVHATSGGTFALGLRVASATTGGTVTVVVDGITQETVTFEATGGAQSWQDATTSLNVTPGNHTVRLVVEQGSFTLNYLTIGEEEGEPNQPPVTCGDTNLALNKPAVASSAEGPFSAGSAFDGNPGTRWGSEFADDEWLRVDLGSSYALCEVTLAWEAAFGRAYELRLGSNTDINASQVIATVSDGDGGTDVVATDNSVSGRYLWMKGVGRGTGYGYSLWEMEVFGSPATVAARTAQDAKPQVVPESSALSSTLTLYPNPVVHTLNVASSTMQQGDYAEVYSALGILLMKVPLQSGHEILDVSALPRGVYMLQVKGTQSKTIRFIKQ